MVDLSEIIKDILPGIYRSHLINAIKKLQSKTIHSLTLIEKEKKLMVRKRTTIQVKSTSTAGILIYSVTDKKPSSRQIFPEFVRSDVNSFHE